MIYILYNRTFRQKVEVNHINLDHLEHENLMVVSVFQCLLNYFKSVPYFKDQNLFGLKVFEIGCGSVFELEYTGTASELTN